MERLDGAGVGLRHVDQLEGEQHVIPVAQMRHRLGDAETRDAQLIGELRVEPSNAGEVRARVRGDDQPGGQSTLSNTSTRP